MKRYCGYIKYRGAYYKAEHVALWDEETHEKIVALLDQRAEQYKLTGVKPGAQTTYLGGLLRCKHCGGKYTKQRGGSNKYGLLYYYVCYSRGGKVKKMVKDPNCKNKNWKMEVLDNLVFEEIRKLAFDPEYTRRVRDEKKTTHVEPDKASLIQAEIEKIDEQISRFMVLYGIGKFSVEQLSKQTDPLNEQRAALSRELEQLNGESCRMTEEEAIKIAENLISRSMMCSC